MRKYSRKLQTLDLSVLLVLFILGCFTGKRMVEMYDHWFYFTVSAIGILGFGLFVWWRIRRRLIRIWEEED